MDRPFQLRHLDHVVLRARDLTGSQRFDGDVLGCTVERPPHEIGLLRLRAGRLLIDRVGVNGKPGRTVGAAAGAKGRNMDLVCLRVDVLDREARCTFVAANGVAAGAFGTRHGEEGDGPSLYIEDPEGNAIELKAPPDSLQAVGAVPAGRASA